MKSVGFHFSPKIQLSFGLLLIDTYRVTKNIQKSTNLVTLVFPFLYSSRSSPVCFLCLFLPFSLSLSLSLSVSESKPFMSYSAGLLIVSSLYLVCVLSAFVHSTFFLICSLVLLDLSHCVFLFRFLLFVCICGSFLSSLYVLPY